METDLRNPEKYVEALLAQQPNLSATKAASLLGTAVLMQAVGEKGLAVVLGSKDPKTAKRLVADCKQYQPQTTPRWAAVRQVEKQLKKFQPLRLEDVWYNPNKEQYND